jgi:hypothetical protein
MIPHYHHHHEDLALNLSVSKVNDDDNKQKHSHEGVHQHNHDSAKKEKSTEHKHPFPFHQHISATNDIYIERTNLLESNIQIRNISLLAFAELFSTEFLKTSGNESYLSKNPPFLISALCNLEAFALRGPPAIV